VIELTAMAKRVATLRIPFAVGPVTGSALLRAAAPTLLGMGEVGKGSFHVRNLGGAWRRGTVTLAAQWVGEDGAVVGPTTRLTTGDVPAGGEAVFAGALPPAPGAVGWYRLRLTLTALGRAPAALAELAAWVRPVGARAEFINIALLRELRPKQDGPQIVPITLRNAGLSAWTPGHTKVVYQWLAWDGRPLPGGAGSAPIDRAVPAGAATTMRLVLTIPAGSGMFRLAFGVEEDGVAALLTAAPADAGWPVAPMLLRPSHFMPIDLADAFEKDDWGADGDTAPVRADLDGHGNTIPQEEFLPDATVPTLGYQPGYGFGPLDASAPGFRFAAPVDGRGPVLRARGQMVGLPAVKGSALHLAACAVADLPDAITLTIKYADGDVPVRLQVSGWLDGPTHGEAIVRKTRHIHEPAGDNWYLEAHVYAYRLPLDPARTLKGIALPNTLAQGGKAPALAIFAMTIEGADGTE
jgi:hypothetical protein